VKEVREMWIRRWRRSEVPMAVFGCSGEGRADGAVPGHFDIEEEWGAGVEEQRGIGVEAHAKDTEEGAWWRRTWRRSEHRRVCDGEMKVLEFRCSGILKKKNSSNKHDNVINARCYI
jgi:hypothetical protein